VQLSSTIPCTCRKHPLVICIPWKAGYTRCSAWNGEPLIQQSRPQDMPNSKQQFGGLMFVCILGGKISMWAVETLICNIR
jgi:hypothetical protein